MPNILSTIWKQIRHLLVLRNLIFGALLTWFVLSVFFVTGVSLSDAAPDTFDRSRSIAILSAITADQENLAVADLPEGVVDQCAKSTTFARFKVKKSEEGSEPEIEEIVVTGSRASSETNGFEQLLEQFNAGSQVAAAAKRLASQEGSRFASSYSVSLALGSFYYVHPIESKEEHVDLWEVSIIPTCIFVRRFSGENEMQLAARILFKIEITPDQVAIRLLPIFVSLERAIAKSFDPLVQLRIASNLKFFEFDEYDESWRLAPEQGSEIEFDMNVGDWWSAAEAHGSKFADLLRQKFEGESDWMLAPSLNLDALERCVKQGQACQLGNARFEILVEETGTGKNFFARLEELF